MSAILVLLALVTSHDVPPQHAVSCVVASVRHGEAPETLCAYLVSEHPGGRYGGACGDGGRSCGPYQLGKLWARRYGYDLADRGHAWRSANIAAQVVAYSHRRHAKKCDDSSHDWRAHMKCHPDHRGSKACRSSVRKWHRLEKELAFRELPEKADS